MLRKTKNKKVVIWENIKSNVVEQAIFVLREDSGYDEDYIVREAQSVIDNFITWQSRLGTGPKATLKKNNKNKGLMKSIFAFLFSATALTLLIYILYRAI